MVAHPFLQRLNVIWRARRDLSAGAFEQALERLADPQLGQGSVVRQLRAQSVDGLCRTATERASEGRDGSVVRILRLVEREDPGRAAHWRRRLMPVDFEHPAERPSMQDLLAELRARGAAAGQQEPSAGTAGLLPELDLRVGNTLRTQPSESAGAAPEREARPARIALGVDDAGEFLVGFGPVLVLGHQRAGRAELPFLADVAPEHVRLIFGGTSFHGGACWGLQPFPGQAVLKNGELFTDSQSVLPVADGDAVSLAPNLTFVFRQPDPSTGAAVLELLAGAECLGSPSVLLFGDPSVDRARIGPGSTATIRAPGFVSEVTLEWSEQGWSLTSEAGFWRPGTWHSEVERALRVRASDPLEERVDLSVGPAPPGQPPFGLYLAPIAGPLYPGHAPQGT